MNLRYQFHFLLSQLRKNNTRLIKSCTDNSGLLFLVSKLSVQLLNPFLNKKININIINKKKVIAKLFINILKHKKRTKMINKLNNFHNIN